MKDSWRPHAGAGAKAHKASCALDESALAHPPVPEQAGERKRERERAREGVSEGEGEGKVQGRGGSEREEGRGDRDRNSEAVTVPWTDSAESGSGLPGTLQSEKEGGARSAANANDDDDERGEEDQSYFAVNLFVAALGDGKLLPTGSRKKQDTLEQVVRN